MKEAEVLAAFSGEAQRLAQPAPFTQPQEGSSVPAGSSDLAIPEYEADGVRFRVLFGFEADALNRIHLSALKPVGTTCGDLEAAVTRKHSAPARRNRTGTTLRGEELIWTPSDQKITLSCAGVPKLGFQTVALDYMAPSAGPPKN